jgi:hypothetical protein
MHRFVLFNFNGLVSVSNEFIIDKNKIIFINNYTKHIIKKFKYLLLNTQFVSGLIETNESRYLITYGEKDYYAKEMIISKDQIIKAF